MQSLNDFLESNRLPTKQFSKTKFNTLNFKAETGQLQTNFIFKID